MEDRYEALRVFLCDKVNQCERSYARRIHGGLILNGGFVEDEEVTSWRRPGYDMISEIHAAIHVARRSLEHLMYTTGRYSKRELLLEAASPGAVPSDGPGSTSCQHHSKVGTQNMRIAWNMRENKDKDYRKIELTTRSICILTTIRTSRCNQC